MPRFQYSLDDASGGSKFLYADDLPHAFLLLRQRGETPKSIAVAKAPPPAMRGISEDLLLAFYEELASLLAQGLELSLALERLAAGAQDGRLARTGRYLADRVAAGEALSEAMDDVSGVFAPFVVSTIAAAEQSGDLSGALRSLATHRRDLQRIGQDVALPLAYPTFLLITIAVLLSSFGWFVWPKFMKLYTDLGMRSEDFPMVTRLVMLMSAGLRIVLPPLIILGFVLLLVFYARRGAQRGAFETRPMGLPIPLFGRLAMYSALARLCSALRMLMSNGVPLDRALRLAGDATGSDHIRFAMRRAEDAVLRGGTLAEGLRETGLLPEAFVFSLSSAESTGEFLPVLEEIEVDYMRRLGYLSRTWIVMAGPVIVLLLGCTVGLMGMAMFSPLIAILGNLSQ
jgi:type II secretory pathway component PulF